MWHSVKTLRRIQWISLATWLLGLAGLWLLPDPWRIISFVVWIISMAINFVAFFRAMWLVAAVKHTR